jgi:pSer/pThr/pTyr-binding forkhead associated (FHA) protein
MAEGSIHGFLLFSTGQQMQLSRFRTVVGREIDRAEFQSSIDLASLPASNTVSHKHAVIEATHGTYSLTDLKSRNTTSVNGQRLTPHCPAVIRHGDVLRFGGVSCTFRISGMQGR